VKRIVLMALSVVLALVLASPMTFAQVGQDAKASGETAELAADWWQWALSKPVEANPLIGGDPNYSEEQCDGQPVTNTPRNTWFLAGTLDGSEVERTCTVPVGTQLFFPVVNYVFLITEPEETEDVARQAVNDHIDGVLADPKFKMRVTVDGKKIKSNQIIRADSPLFTATVPEGGLLDAGSYDGVADGLWVTLPRLSVGEHTIHFEISAPNAGFSQDKTYYLTVE
jgi:predicted small secreted protein